MTCFQQRLHVCCFGENPLSWLCPPVGCTSSWAALFHSLRSGCFPFLLGNAFLKGTDTSVFHAKEGQLPGSLYSTWPITVTSQWTLPHSRPWDTGLCVPPLRGLWGSFCLPLICSILLSTPGAPSLYQRYSLHDDGFDSGRDVAGGTFEGPTTMSHAGCSEPQGKALITPGIGVTLSRNKEWKPGPGERQGGQGVPGRRGPSAGA